MVLERVPKYILHLLTQTKKKLALELGVGYNNEIESNENQKRHESTVKGENNKFESFYSWLDEGESEYAMVQSRFFLLPVTGEHPAAMQHGNSSNSGAATRTLALLLLLLHAGSFAR